MLVLVIACAAIGQTAGADDLVIALERDTPIAPSTVTLTASVATGDPILSYHWSGIPAAPRCREKECSFTIELSSCTAVELEAVTAFGETLTATRAVCADSSLDSHPPSIHLSVRNGRARTIGTTGSDPLIFNRTWVDGIEVLESPTDVEVPTTPGCHSIDALAADERGRIAVAQKTVCSDADDPQIWVGGAPSSFVSVGQRYTLCAESAHPLGLPIEWTGGEPLTDDCTFERSPPPSIQHKSITATDSRGISSVAGAFFSAAPLSGPRVLFFAQAQPNVRWTNGQAGRVSISLYGGVPPFAILDRSAPLFLVEDASDVLVAELSTVSLPVGANTIQVTLLDAAGFQADASFEVMVAAGTIIPKPPGNGMADAVAGCRCTTGSPSLVSVLALIVFALLSWRTRR